MENSIKFRLQNQYQQIIRLIDGLNDAFVTHRHRPDKWSIKENLAHLGRYHEVFEHRIKSILTMNQPEFGRYKAEDDPDFPAWKALENSVITRKTIYLRNRITKQLENLHDHSLNRQGKHPRLGYLSVEGWTEFFLLHESHHIYAVFGLVNEFKSKTNT